MMAGWLIALCWAVSFIFAGLEAGLFSVDQVRLRHQVNCGVPAALKLQRLLQTPERLLVTVLLVTNLADIVALLLLVRFLVGALGRAGYLGALLFALPFNLFILGILPKSLFRRFPYRALAALAGLLQLTSLILWPVLELGALIGRVALGKRRTESRRLFAAREDLKQFTTESEREGSITSAERALIHNVVDFRAVKVSDVMLPLDQVISVSPEASPSDVLRLSAERGIERFPIITAQGETVGLANVLDILLDREPADSLRPYVRRIVTADENEPAYWIILRLRAARLSLAGVLDARKKLQGIVTLEDLVKRLVQSA
jgi:putative hemolysin